MSQPPLVESKGAWQLRRSWKGLRGLTYSRSSRISEVPPRPDGGVVTQRTANPCTPVRFRLGPPPTLCVRVRTAAVRKRTADLQPKARETRFSLNVHRCHVAEVASDVPMGSRRRAVRLIRSSRLVRAFAVFAHPQLVEHADALQISEIARTAHFAERALINSRLPVFLLSLNLLDHT